MKIDLDTVAEFTWAFGSDFYLETEHGNYLWSDPNRGGDNTVKRCCLSKREWEKPFWGSSRGKHTIREFCGDKVIILK